MGEQPFWKTKTLAEMTGVEWESLCDGCGLCCLNKLEDWDTGEIAWTNVGCTLLDGESCRCKDYPNRQATVPDCIQLTPEEVETLSWLPPTCGYRLVRDGIDLYWWHPLVSGDPETVHQAGISVRGRTVSEDDIDVEELEDYLVEWPLTVGEQARDRVYSAGTTGFNRLFGATLRQAVSITWLMMPSSASMK
jgi:uncharacterized cysteine cluster protein YcgN (CxxCxxCC family)